MHVPCGIGRHYKVHTRVHLLASLQHMESQAAEVAAGCTLAAGFHLHLQVNFHTTLSGEAMVTLVYHKKLDDVWKEAALAARDRMHKKLAADCTCLSIIGRSRKQKIELDQSHVIERMVVGGREYVYKQVGITNVWHDDWCSHSCFRFSPLTPGPQPADCRHDHILYFGACVTSVGCVTIAGNRQVPK